MEADIPPKESYLTTTSVGIVGAGNVGSALLMELTRLGTSVEVQVCSRRLESAQAAILDVLSAFPDATRSFRPVSRLDNGLDVVVITAGVQHEDALAHDELLRLNTELALGTVEHCIDDHTVFILVGSPVDEVSEHFANARPDIDPRRIIGFGGDLDRCRLVAALSARGIDRAAATVVGEHGHRAIPVYGGELHYDAIAGDVRSVLLRIRTATGKARNLASGIHIARLVESLCKPDPSMHCLSALHSEWGIFLTWPYRLSSSGLGERIGVDLGYRAQTELSRLLAQRRSSLRSRGSATHIPPRILATPR